jgi:hypothetical protein
VLNVTIDIGNAEDARIAAAMFAALAAAYGGAGVVAVLSDTPPAPRPRGRPPKNTTDPAEAYANLGGTLPAEAEPVVAEPVPDAERVTPPDESTRTETVVDAPAVENSTAPVEPPAETPTRTDAEILDAARAVARAKGALWLRAWLTATKKDKLSDFAVADMLKVEAGQDAPA